MTYEGKVVLNYKLTKKLGEGGFGAVYLAEQVDLGRRAAIKILHHQFASQPQVVERFFREARAVCEIGHRAIVAIENFGKLPETEEPFYLMEFFPGGSLTQITSERWLTSEQLVAILDPIADALGAAHGKHIIHRDLKPDNIMVRIANDRVADVRLLDFGIAKLLDGDHSKSMTGSAMGTPSYMPPEQALDAKNVDVRADVYSFGATVYAAFCGRPPFEGDTVAAILLAAQQTTAPVLATRRPDVPPELDAAVRRCLAKQREHRPASIADAWSAIRAELVRANLSSSPAQPSPLVAPTVPPTGAARTPQPMRPVTPLPVAAPHDTPAAPSAITPVPGTMRAPAIDQAATTPEVPSRSRRPLVLGIAGLAIAGTVTAIVVAKATGGPAPAEAPVAIADAAPAAIDATIDATVVASADAAAPAVADAATALQPLAPDDVIGPATKAAQALAQTCRSRPARANAPTTKLTLTLDIDPAGAVGRVGVEGTSSIAGCLAKQLKSTALTRPSTTGGSFVVTILVAADEVAVTPPDPKPNPKPPDPKPPDPRPTACSAAALEAIAKAQSSTEAVLRQALGHLNSCRDQGKIAHPDWQRIQTLIVARL